MAPRENAPADRLEGDAGVLARLAAAGITSVRAALERSECVRDLAGRSNHVLRVGDLTLHMKRTKPRSTLRGKRARAEEADALERLGALGVPTATLALRGVDPDLGALTGTRDLAPAQPLDDLLRAGTLAEADRRPLARALAAAVARLHDSDLHHRDLYLNHVYADVARPSHVVLIDVERVRRHRRTLGRWVVKDLAALDASAPSDLVSDGERTRFLLRYLACRGIPARGVLPGLVRRIRAKSRRIRGHAPRTPVGEAARP